MDPQCDRSRRDRKERSLSPPKAESGRRERSGTLDAKVWRSAPTRYTLLLSLSDNMVESLRPVSQEEDNPPAGRKLESVTYGATIPEKPLRSPFCSPDVATLSSAQTDPSRLPVSSMLCCSAAPQPPPAMTFDPCPGRQAPLI
ncbi:unnamed protein product [Pleuronectes platessa]|uniref:Uncharacterized protein n=1 Tax=Pleuronectes platessa TaxID=8262 RepID=A0A9N7U9N8_PLEPL|nr:unnamed protein product [Pleuronectes platessa]